MNICFVLPFYGRRITGGFKMAFDYANGLCERGHKVTILFLNEHALEAYKVPQFVKRIACEYFTKKEPRWYDLNPRITKISGISGNFKSKLKDVDAYIATEVRTAEFVKMANPLAKKMYYIQDYETWIMPQEYVQKTYAYGFKNIVISTKQKNIVDSFAAEPSILIRNPVDTDVYKPVVPIQERYHHSISFLYHNVEGKGTVYAIETVKKLKSRYPDLKAYAFGTIAKGDDLPSFVDYTYCATRDQTVEIYNKSTVFLCASYKEGYGLTGLEAIACGAVLVSSNYQAVAEYAIDGVNALLAPVKNVEELVKRVINVFEDDSLKRSISDRAIETVRNHFSKENALDAFEDAITG